MVMTLESARNQSECCPCTRGHRRTHCCLYTAASLGVGLQLGLYSKQLWPCGHVPPEGSRDSPFAKWVLLAMGETSQRPGQARSRIVEFRPVQEADKDCFAPKDSGSGTRLPRLHSQLCRQAPASSVAFMLCCRHLSPPFF